MTTTYTTKTQSAPSTRSATSPIGPDGVVRCHHGVEVPLLISTSSNNPGRKFYTCTKNRGDPDKCTFFKWADELPQTSQAAAVPSHSQPKTPAKRSHAMTPTTQTTSPSKAAASAPRYRLDPIEDGDEIVNLISDEETSQFLSAPSDQPPAKKYRFSTDEKSGRNGTPRNSSGGEYFPLSTMKTPTQKAGQWQAIRDDPENPFHDHAASVAQARPSGQPLSSQTTPVATGDSIQEAVDIFLSVPDTVRRLERKVTAAEKARDAKATRIVQLQEEIRDLKDRNRSLEEAMEALKARR